MQSFVETLRRRAVDERDREAFTYLSEDAQESRCTYGELDARARAIGARLRQGGTGSVLLLYAPGRHFVEAFFGCLYAGRVAVPAYPPDPINVERALTRLRHVLADARPTTVVMTREVCELMAGFADQVPELAGPEWVMTEEIGPTDAPWTDPAESWDGVAFLQYTSGSTRAPRGVMLSHGNLLTNSEYIKQAFGHTRQSQGVIWLPPYHDMGLIGGILQPVYAGFPCALMSPMDFLSWPMRWLRAVSRFRATTSGGPSFAYELCAKRRARAKCEGMDLSSWTVAFNGAEPIHPATLERFVDAFGPLGFKPEAFLPCYGLAESTLAVTCAPRAAPPTVGAFDPHALGLGSLREPSPAATEVSRLVSCGRPDAQHVVRIVDPGTRILCADGTVGEIWVKGPSVARGYWEKPEETQATFGATLAGTGEGPFLRTGDLGAMLGGELYVAGRLKDVIIIQGRNHYPHDIEATVSTCHGELRPNCGVAFSVSGEAGQGERLVVVHEVRRAEGLDGHEVIKKIRGAVAQQNCIQVHSVVLLPPRALPKTSSGKVQRQLCRSLFLKGELEAVATWSLNSHAADHVATPRG